MYVSLRDRPTGGSTGSRLATRVASTVIALGVVSLLTDVSSEMVSAILPIYLTSELGMGLLAYGVVDGLYQGVSSLVRIAGGYLADRNRRPKWVALVGYGVSALSRIAMLAVHGFGGVTAVVTLDRLGKGLRTAPRDALIADVTEPAMMGRAFGVHRTLDTIGAAIGPLVAFGLLAAIPRGYNSVFVASAGFALVGVAVLVFLVPNRLIGRGTTALSPRELLRTVAAPHLRRTVIAVALLGLLTVGDGFLYLSMQQRDHFAAVYFPLLYVGTNIAYLALALPLGRLADRVGKARVFVVGHLALLAAYLVAAAPRSGAGWTVVALMLLGSFYAATDGVLAALVSRLMPAQARGTGIAAAQTATVLARFASSLMFGALWTALGRGPALLLVGGALICALPLAAMLLRSAMAAAPPSAAPAAPPSAAPAAGGPDSAPPALPTQPAVPPDGSAGVPAAVESDVEPTRS